MAANSVTRANGIGVFNFQGGNLMARLSTATFFQGLTTANVRGTLVANSGAVVNTNGFNVTIAQPLVHSTIGGDAATDGGLTKTGLGTLTLSGASTYTRATNILNGNALPVAESCPCPREAPSPLREAAQFRLRADRVWKSSVVYS